MVTEQKTKERILSILIENSRKSYRTIAKELNISTTTVSRIINEFEDSKIILGYTTMIDWHKIGYDSTLCLQLSVTSDADIDTIGKTLRSIQELKQVFYTTGDATFSAYAVCKNTESAAELLGRLRSITGIERIISHTVLKTF